MNTSWSTFSECGLFRYLLVYEWDPTLPALGVVMLNPSRADGHKVKDPTANKVIGFGGRLGFGSVIIGNLFAFVATDPADLRAAGYPIGPDNDMQLRRLADSVGTVVCAWGAGARGLARPAEVLRLLRDRCANLRAFAFTADGIPRHPLYLPGKSELQPYA